MKFDSIFEEIFTLMATSLTFEDENIRISNYSDCIPFLYSLIFKQIFVKIEYPLPF